MTFNKLAQIIAKREGKKQNVNIAQIKEILKITLILQSNMPPKELVSLLSKYGNTKLTTINFMDKLVLFALAIQIGILYFTLFKIN